MIIFVIDQFLCKDMFGATVTDTILYDHLN